MSKTVAQDNEVRLRTTPVDEGMTETGMVIRSMLRRDLDTISTGNLVAMLAGDYGLTWAEAANVVRWCASDTRNLLAVFADRRTRRLSVRLDRAALARRVEFKPEAAMPHGGQQ